MRLFNYYGNRAYGDEIALDFTTSLLTPKFQIYLVTQKICVRECYDHFDPPAEYVDNFIPFNTLDKVIDWFIKNYEASSIIYIDGLNFGEISDCEECEETKEIRRK